MTTISSSPKMLDAKLAVTVMMIIALLFPFGLSMWPGTNSMLFISVAWSLHFEWYGVFLSYNGPEMIVMMGPIALLRCIFALQIFRYYHGKTTYRRTLVVGILVELPFWILMILSTLLGLGSAMVSFPLPFLFIVGILMAWRYPHHRDEEKDERWWQQQK